MVLLQNNHVKVACMRVPELHGCSLCSSKAIPSTYSHEQTNYFAVGYLDSLRLTMLTCVPMSRQPRISQRTHQRSRFYPKMDFPADRMQTDVVKDRG